MRRRRRRRRISCRDAAAEGNIKGEQEGEREGGRGDTGGRRSVHISVSHFICVISLSCCRRGKGSEPGAQSTGGLTGHLSLLCLKCHRRIQFVSPVLMEEPPAPHAMKGEPGTSRHCGFLDLCVTEADRRLSPSPTQRERNNADNLNTSSGKRPRSPGRCCVRGLTKPY